MYCYRVWLRHLILAQSVGLPTNPCLVAELGPGDSLGTGIAALLTGAATYIAVDLVDYAATRKNIEMVDRLYALLSSRTPVPVPDFGNPGITGDLFFPGQILDDDRLDAALSPSRVRAVRAAVSEPGPEHDGIRVAYSTGEGKTLELEPALDLVFSQAVLEHVDDLEQVYAAISAALRPGGFASHAIDFKSHHFARGWDGHWTFSDRTWAVVRGRRRFAINREPLATHLQLIAAAGLEVVNVHRTIQASTIARSDLAPRFRTVSEEDLRTSSAIVQAVKR